jgi:hypothetical protein
MAAKQEVYALKLHAYWVHITFFFNSSTILSWLLQERDVLDC